MHAGKVGASHYTKSGNSGTHSVQVATEANQLTHDLPLRPLSVAPATIAPVTGKSIRDQLWHAADPDGSQRALIDAAALAGRAPTWLQRLGRSVDASLTRLADLGQEQTALMDSIEAAVSLLVPRGWAVMNMDHAAVSAAVTAVRAGNPGDADDLLAGQWEGDGDWRIKRVGQRVRAMAAADDELSALFRERARLLDRAAEHHRAGRYDASVPILLAHIEGIVIDVTDGDKYFTKRPKQKADVVNPHDLAGIEACMAVLQGVYGDDVPDTQAAGSLSRHGILHGRELAYDTRVNSAKVWSVMDAIVHWALPKSRDLADARRAARQGANAGCGETDEQGRRVDNREIAETRDALRFLGTSAMGWHRQRGRLRDDLVGTRYDAKDLTKGGLPADPGIATEVSGDGQAVAYWRETDSGRVLGLALTWDGEHFGEYLFAGEDSPVGVPGERGSTWGDLFATPLDWGG